MGKKNKRAEKRIVESKLVEKLDDYVKLDDNIKDQIKDFVKDKIPLARTLKPGEKKDDLGIDDFSDLVADEACEAAHFLAGLFMDFGTPEGVDPDEIEIQDGQYEEIKDACEALARAVARKLGFPLNDLNPAHLHRIEKGLQEWKKPTCPADCEFLASCTDKPSFHHIPNKTECVVWHMKQSNITK